jgi:predicted GIY-YIG superfamily endonuclease
MIDYATAREKEIKAVSRVAKNALIVKINSKWTIYLMK